jgi:endoglucanase
MVKNAKYLIEIIICGFLLFAGSTWAQESEMVSDIYLNQVGYKPNDRKIASIKGDQEVSFNIRRIDNDQVVYKGNLKQSGHWKSSGEDLLVADFTELQTEGEYYLEIPELGSSSSFAISTDIYAETLKASAKAYYYWRCSSPIEEEFGGKWSRPAGHIDTSILVHPSAANSDRPAGTIISAPGGWYDAGDYNKYIVNSGISTYTLMAAYEFNPDLFDSLKWNIPESGDTIPDLLNEVFYNMKWMLSMQDSNDGGVYHKLTTSNFGRESMPHEVRPAKRYVVQKTTGATLNFAAVLAVGSRILRKHYPEFADQCLAASEKSWLWARKNSGTFYKQEELNKKFDPDINTGAYNNQKLKDEFAWAASELYVASQKKKYLNHWHDYYGTTHHIGVPSWGNTAMLGIYSLLRNRKSLPDLSPDDIQILKRQLLKEADALSNSFVKSPNQTAFGNKASDYKWGSNAIAANQGMLLLHAWQLTGKQIYYEGAQSNLDYILGRNATGYCFVTGIGHKNPQNPHHRISAADGVDAPVPGLLVGGACSMSLPNSTFPSDKPAKRYLDEYSCYVTNEVAINWNAPLVFLISGIINDQ